MKQQGLWLLLILIITCRVTPLHGQSEVRDSLIDESLRDFFSEHVDLMHGISSYMLAAHTFPYDYDLSVWNKEGNIGIANFYDTKTLRRYKRTKRGIPTICLKWEIDQYGFMIFKVALYYIIVRRETIDYALSDACTYYYKYSYADNRWLLASKSCTGV